MKFNCEVCGSKKDLNCHHSDYSKPLVFQTLCSQCHHNIHRENNYLEDL